jgi:hypothetical protein
MSPMAIMRRGTCERARRSRGPGSGAWSGSAGETNGGCTCVLLIFRDGMVLLIAPTQPRPQGLRAGARGASALHVVIARPRVNGPDGRTPFSSMNARRALRLAADGRRRVHLAPLLGRNRTSAARARPLTEAGPAPAAAPRPPDAHLPATRPPRASCLRRPGSSRCGHRPIDELRNDRFDHDVAGAPPPRLQRPPAPTPAGDSP